MFNRIVEKFKVPEKQEEKLNLKEEIIEAIKSKDREQLLSVLKEVNKKLTGLETADFNPSTSGIKQLEEKIAKFFDEIENDADGSSSLIVYLGDSGLSRLSLGVDFQGEAIVELTYNSTKEVEKKWSELNEESKE